MAETQITKPYDLEERTFKFAQAGIAFIKKLPRTISNIEISKQLVRAAESVGANYIEANEALGKKDFLLHTRISRKEAKESRYWLRLAEINDVDMENERQTLAKESQELMNIFGSIVRKTEA
ncbi:four helix bundle protein [candidate division TA06 bacterium]|uniref:Four helix bundle protein n=1 Tax=candidate division TA06 bacterium TaxID=2250710 RepID=A0A933I765_UNCT6|nr:four helix bundle protein [candidate division TA06 bacterium]